MYLAQLWRYTNKLLFLHQAMDSSGKLEANQLFIHPAAAAFHSCHNIF